MPVMHARIRASRSGGLQRRKITIPSDALCNARHGRQAKCRQHSVACSCARPAMRHTDVSIRAKYLLLYQRALKTIGWRVYLAVQYLYSRRGGATSCHSRIVDCGETTEGRRCRSAKRRPTSAVYSPTPTLCWPTGTNRRTTVQAVQCIGRFAWHL
jgi:hypothetical protein